MKSRIGILFLIIEYSAICAISPIWHLWALAFLKGTPFSRSGEAEI